MNYMFTLNYLPGKKRYIADVLSRNIIKPNLPEDVLMKDVVRTVTVGSLTISGPQTKEDNNCYSLKITLNWIKLLNWLLFLLIINYIIINYNKLYMKC